LFLFRFPEVNDMSAMGVRINGGLDFTDEDFAWMRRYKQREKLERKAGLAHGDLRDMRSVWKEATHRLYRLMMPASSSSMRSSVCVLML
jgi:hypothetical protein